MATTSGLQANRTTTGKKRKQLVTGAKDSALNSLRAQYAQSGFATPVSRAKTNVAPTGLAAKYARSGAGSPSVAAATVAPTYTAPKTTSPTIVPLNTTGVTNAMSTGAGATPTGKSNVGSGAEVGVSGANDITGALTGKVGGYGIRPDAIPMIYQEPQTLLRMTMQNMGMDPTTNAGMYHMALPNADLVNALSMIGLGGQKGFNAGENSSVLNYMDELFRQGLTRGGQGVDFSSGMDNIMGASANSPLAQMMNLDDPRGQVQAVSSLMLPLAEAGLHPLFANALQKSLQGLADEYYQQYASGAKPPANFQGFAGGRLGL